MITNVLLEEKYRGQRRLMQKAKAANLDYLQVVGAEVVNLFKANGWPLHYAARTGGSQARIAEDHDAYTAGTTNKSSK